MEDLMSDFFYDDFFVSQDERDPGKEVTVKIRGRDVPIRIKRGLSLEDREAAKNQAITKRITPDGKPEIVKLDEGIFAIELLVRNIIYWPFKFRSGRLVPITRETIKAMLADGVDALTKAVMTAMQEQAETTAPFLNSSEQTSGEPSSEAAQTTQ
jgi:hypothetical protein